MSESTENPDYTGDRAVNIDLVVLKLRTENQRLRDALEEIRSNATIYNREEVNIANEALKSTTPTLNPSDKTVEGTGSESI